MGCGESVRPRSPTRLLLRGRIRCGDLLKRRFLDRLDGRGPSCVGRLRNAEADRGATHLSRGRFRRSQRRLPMAVGATPLPGYSQLDVPTRLGIEGCGTRPRKLPIDTDSPCTSCALGIGRLHKLGQLRVVRDGRARLRDQPINTRVRFRRARHDQASGCHIASMASCRACDNFPIS
jgi:hypothetical protein